MSRVCIIGNATSVHVQRWARAVAERGWDVLVFGPFDDEIEGVRTQAWSSSPGLGGMLQAPRQWREMRSVVAAYDPDLVWVHFVRQGPRLFGLDGSRPLVATAYGSDITAPAVGIGGRSRAASMSRLFDRSTRITSPSEFLRTAMTEAFPKTAGRVSLVPFGVETDVFVPAARTPGPCRFVFAKTLSERYGADILLEAAARLTADGIDFTLELIGGGDAGAWQERVSDRGVADRVTVVGRLPHAELPARIAAADVGVMPTVVPESFGVAALEASSCGLPVVASDIGGIPEVVADGETGLLVPAGDADALAAAMSRLGRDAELRERLGSAGRRLVQERYEWDVCVDLMIEELENATGEDRADG